MWTDPKYWSSCTGSDKRDKVSLSSWLYADQGQQTGCRSLHRVPHLLSGSGGGQFRPSRKQSHSKERKMCQGLGLTKHVRIQSWESVGCPLDLETLPICLTCNPNGSPGGTGTPHSQAQSIAGHNQYKACLQEPWTQIVPISLSRWENVEREGTWELFCLKPLLSVYIYTHTHFPQPPLPHRVCGY